MTEPGPARFPLLLDSTAKVTRSKRVDGETVRTTTWRYAFKAADKGTAIVIRTDEERPWLEDETFEVTIGQRSYQLTLFHPPAKKGRKKKGAADA